MVRIQIPRGDFGFPIPFILTDADCDPIDLSIYDDINFYVWKSRFPNAPVVTGLCTIDVAVDGKCHYEVKEGDFDKMGTWKANCIGIRAGERQSWLPFEIEVIENPSVS